MQQITYKNKTNKPQKSSFIITSTKEEPDGIEKPNHVRTAPTVTQGEEEDKKSHTWAKNEEKGEEKI